MKKSEFKNLVKESVREELNEAKASGRPRPKIVTDMKKKFKELVDLFTEYKTAGYAKTTAGSSGAQTFAEGIRKMKSGFVNL
jgi:hypothetical protein